MSRKTGTTLIEIVLAVLILALSMLPIFGIMSYSGGATRYQKAEGVAAGLAKEEMNRLMYALQEGNVKTDDWSYGDDFNVEGNFYTGKVTVFKYSDAAVNVRYAEIKPHNYQSCSATGESVTRTAADFDTRNKPITEIRKPSKIAMADIMLRVTWRLPNETAPKATNFIVLVGRRAFLE